MICGPDRAQNEIAPSAPAAEGALRSRGPRRHSTAIVHLWSDNRSTSEAASELHSSRLGALHPQPIKISDLNGLAGFGSRPFRLAKLTACRKSGVCIGAGPECQGERAEIIGVSGARRASATEEIQQFDTRVLDIHDADGNDRERPRISFHFVLIKPSHYDDDGYPIQWLRSAIPSNTLACLNGLAQDAQRRQVLGPDVDIRLAHL